MKVELFVAKPTYAKAVRVDSVNMADIAEMVKGQLFSYASNGHTGEPFIRIESNHGHIKVRSGMWVVNNGRGWVAMTDLNFHRRFVHSGEEPAEWEEIPESQQKITRPAAQFRKDVEARVEQLRESPNKKLKKIVDDVIPDPVVTPEQLRKAVQEHSESVDEEVARLKRELGW